MSEDNDSIWGSSDEDDVRYERTIAEKEWNRMHQNHGNEGYKDGIIEGKEVVMQKGFDRGYEDGLGIGRSMGYLRGELSTWILFYQQMVNNPEAVRVLELLLDEVNKVDVHHIYTKEYFQDNSKSAEYVSPQDFVKSLQDKVSSTLIALQDH
ncbi:hypothetical protein J3Q64DRAFT_1844092 [Phycomyces blakesleeanus]|uniref:Protein YAE1 n=2 Tax=Phycomyces blakesleeanus TaxID=4837 RepID=A0A167P5J1_PHYB8|nr:hypothetical protein PHYBLDRAFT_141172 [Phycomyces blakesleeanus NRRL 1555(-)]OAD77286.1 hypothetical protein PHYBLDRAFT_141172 [Phycomyces blakesleeanus NRRL 1555(-)]|eukprot:XP_018295326.1 hypothetical protein PHYBLDRAFT_141172 [Phycomyces blakesleeanus NRRL 1555(-)]